MRSKRRVKECGRLICIKMTKYIVTGYVKKKGRRDTITKPATKKQAHDSKKSLESELTRAVPKYRWVKSLCVEEVKI